MQCYCIVQTSTMRTPAPMAIAMRPPGLFDENSPHRLSRGGEEMVPAIPIRRRCGINQPQIRLVDYLLTIAVGQTAIAACQGFNSHARSACFGLGDDLP
jgi:hypothetical protein